MREAIKVLDHGYVRFIEAWGHGDAGEDAKGDYRIDLDEVVHTHDYECGIIEAARQSTQGSFRGWDDQKCPKCGIGTVYGIQPGGQIKCAECDGKGYLPGDERLLKFLFSGKPQHATPFEFSGMVLEIKAPIFVFREWHRHRTFSYNEASARYAPLPDDNYIPPMERLFLNSKKNKQAGTLKDCDDLTETFAKDWLEEQKELYEAFERHYQRGLKGGIPKEVARIGMPVGRYSKMRASTCLRNWLAFMTLRADPAAQEEIRQFAHAVGTLVEHYFPRTWNLYKLGRG